MIYFVSDTHFGHKRCIGYCQRPFSSTEEMDSTIIDNINNIVKPKDTLYFLGDFCHRGGDPKEYRKQIFCEDIHMVLGNHDEPAKFTSVFSSVSDQKMILYINQKIFMCHYPMRSWPCSHKRSFHCYGHTHSRLDNEDKNSSRKTLDVGVDNCINYDKPFGQPFSFKEIQYIMNKKRPS